jgi:hypothetical protein
MACKAFSVEVAVLTPDDKKEIHFGLTRGCNTDGSDFWTIDFIYKDDRGSGMKKRVEVHVTVGENKKPKAAALAEAAKAEEPLPDSKVNLLLGRIKDRALQLPKNTTKDPDLERLLMRLIN